MWDDRSRLWFHAQATIAEAAAGFGLAASLGFLLAVAIVGSRGGRGRGLSVAGGEPGDPDPRRRAHRGGLVDYGAAQVMVAFVVAFSSSS